MLVEVTAFGYATAGPTALRLRQDQVTLLVRLSPSPLGLEAIEVTARRMDPRHLATLEGARFRRDLLPEVGPNRVVFRDDAPFRGISRPADVLRWFPDASDCLIAFWDGRLVPDSLARDFWLDEVSPEWVEAVEFYRRWMDAPLEYREIPPYVTSPAGCSVVALWARVDPPESRLPRWLRIAATATVTTTLVVIGSLWISGAGG